MLPVAVDEIGDFHGGLCPGRNAHCELNFLGTRYGTTVDLRDDIAGIDSRVLGGSAVDRVDEEPAILEASCDAQGRNVLRSAAEGRLGEVYEPLRNSQKPMSTAA